MIKCDIDGPIIRMHFHSHPTYEEVMEWIGFCDKALSLKQKFVVISTFEPNYQFEHNARKQQSFWFKAAKAELARWCLGMFRVTSDEVIIQKIQKPSMKRNMPFSCTVTDTVEEAEQLALETLQNADLDIRQSQT